MASWSPVHSSAVSVSSRCWRRCWWRPEAAARHRHRAGGRREDAVAYAVADGARRTRARVLRVELAPLDGPGPGRRRDRRRGRGGASSRARLEAGRGGRGALGDERVAAGARQLRASRGGRRRRRGAAGRVPRRDGARDEPARPGLRRRAHVPAGAAGAARLARSDPARAARSAAVALFVARARARDPGFELTPEVTAGGRRRSAAGWTACRWRSSLPRARVAALPPPAMLARWDAAVGLDAQGARDLPPRQQTLRRAIDWSYELLGRDERALLRRLAAFPGGFDIARSRRPAAATAASLPRARPRADRRARRARRSQPGQPRSGCARERAALPAAMDGARVSARAAGPATRSRTQPTC